MFIFNYCQAVKPSQYSNMSSVIESVYKRCGFHSSALVRPTLYFPTLLFLSGNSNVNHRCFGMVTFGIHWPSRFSAVVLNSYNISPKTIFLENRFLNSLRYSWFLFDVVWNVGILIMLLSWLRFTVVILFCCCCCWHSAIDFSWNNSV